LPYLIDKVKEVIVTANKRAIAAVDIRDTNTNKVDFHKMFEDELK